MRNASNGLSLLPQSSEFETLRLLLEDSAVSPQVLTTQPLQPWLKAQSVNVARHIAALRPFRAEDFGKIAASPSLAHLSAANGLIIPLRSQLQKVAHQVKISAIAARKNPQSDQLHRLLHYKDRGSKWVKLVEKIWDFYWEIFSQRQSRFGSLLLGADRIALDCYQVIYTHLGIVKSIPTPGSFSYMETGFSPAAFRRGIPLTKLGKQINPFPLIQLPYHRLVNPWTLGAILHEVAHALQTDLNLRQAVPRAIARRLHQAGMSPLVIKTWCRWNSEMWADACGLLLGGPVAVESLMDIAARSPKITLLFRTDKPHPTPFLRIYINIELLCRMGFTPIAQQYCRMWKMLYPDPGAGNIPREILKTFHRAKRLVVDTVCFTPYRELGDRTLAQVTGEFQPRHQQMIIEAGRRLATGKDPGIIPERFLIGASRWALNKRLAEPNQITRNFYRALERR